VGRNVADAQRCAVLHPAVAEAARRAGAPAIALIDVGGSGGLNLQVDRVGITYDDGRSLGDSSSPVLVSASVKGDRPVPTRAVPEVVARIGADVDPLDVTDADAVRRLRTGLATVQPELLAGLDAAMALAATAPPLLVRGDPVDVLPEVLDDVPVDILPIVTTTWALSSASLDDRVRFLRALDGAATHRRVAWVSVEGVGVAPAVPTMGDRPASGHSIVGVAVFDHSTLRTEAIGRCWSRGRWLSWLADSESGPGVP
jgi:hypothetical protein